jgi:hypothetical protein
MKITKIIVATIAAFVVNSISFAGELSVTGSAKATYSIRSDDSTTSVSDNGKGIGIANEFSLGATGETDNGIAWAYQQDIDGATVQDDAKLTLTHSTFGTFGVFVSEGGLSSKLKWDVSAYGAGSDYGWSGNSSTSHRASGSAVAWTYGDDIGGYNNFQYHTPSGILPNDISVKIAYAPSLGAAANNSSNATGTASGASTSGNNATQIQVSGSPVPGASLSASYMEKDNQNVVQRQYEAGGLSGKYAVGPVSFGYGRFYVQPTLLGAQSTIFTQHYINDSYGVSFNVNDALSLSYTNEQSEANKETVVDAEVETQVTAEITAVQAAYTMGGMTLSLAHKEIENMDYTSGKNGLETIVAVSLAF